MRNYEIAKNKDTDSKTLEKLSDEIYIFTRRAVSENPNTPVHVLEKLSVDKENSVRIGVALNTNCPSELLEKMYSDIKNYADIYVGGDKFQITWVIASNPNTPVSILHELSEYHGSHSEKYWEQVAENPSTPIKILEKFVFNSSSGYVREKVAKNPSTPSNLLYELLTCNSYSARKAARKNSNTPKLRKELYFFKQGGQKIYGTPDCISGDISNIYGMVGDFTHKNSSVLNPITQFSIVGDVSKLSGDVTELEGNIKNETI